MKRFFESLYTLSDILEWLANGGVGLKKMETGKEKAKEKKTGMGKEKEKEKKLDRGKGEMKEVVDEGKKKRNRSNL